jgi:uncharacterized membrane protein
MKVLPVVLVIAYPALVHASVVLDAPPLALAGLLVLVAAVLFRPLSQARPAAWLGFAAAALALWLLTRAGAGRLAIYLPSLAIPAALGWLFGSTLRAGREPLISGFARLARGGVLAPDLQRYTRRLTQLWTLMFALMVATALTLILLEQIAWWSFVSNVLNYLLIGLLFALEYAYRRWRFPHHHHPGFVEHLRAIARNRQGAAG